MVWDVCRSDFVGLHRRRKDVKGVASGEGWALISAIVAGRSERMRRAKWGGGGCDVLCAAVEAVVSQRPGSG